MDSNKTGSFKEKKMTVHVARAILVKHRQDYNRDRLAWLPNGLYRTWREASPKFREPVRGS